MNGGIRRVTCRPRHPEVSDTQLLRVLQDVQERVGSVK